MTFVPMAALVDYENAKGSLVSSALLSMQYVMQLHTGITCCKTPTTRQTLYRLKFPTMHGRSSYTGPLMLYTV